MIRSLHFVALPAAIRKMRFARRLLFTDDFDENPFGAFAVELAVEDLFPGAEIELSFSNGNDHFAAHDLTLVMRVAVVFAGSIVTVAGRRRVERCQFFEPVLVILMQTRLVVVDENGRRDVHRIDKCQPFLHTALAHRVGDLPGDVDELHPVRNIER